MAQIFRKKIKKNYCFYVDTFQVWSDHKQDNSEDIAKKTFMELEKHNSEIEQTKASIERYFIKNQTTENLSKNNVGDLNVNDLLAQGEEVIEKKSPAKNKVKARKRRDDSESEVEDWEEVNGMTKCIIMFLTIES